MFLESTLFGNITFSPWICLLVCLSIGLSVGLAVGLSVVLSLGLSVALWIQMAKMWPKNLKIKMDSLTRILRILMISLQFCR